MSEIKPVYQVRTVPHGWKEIPEEKYQNALDNLEIDGRLLYPAAAYEALKAENEALRKKVEELLVTTGMQYLDIANLKSALSAYGDPDVLADDED